MANGIETFKTTERLKYDCDVAEGLLDAAQVPTRSNNKVDECWLFE